MNIDELKHRLSSSSSVLLFCIIGALIIAIGYSLYNRALYRTSFNFYIQKKGSDATNEYKFDQYYSIQNIQHLTKFIAGVLKDPVIIAPLFAKEKLPYTNRHIKVREKNLGIIGLTLYSRSEVGLKKIAEQIRIEANNVMANLKDSADPVYFQVASSDPLVERNPSNFWFNCVIALIIAGGIFGIYTLGRTQSHK